MSNLINDNSPKNPLDLLGQIQNINHNTAPYEAEINRKNPTAFVLMIDQSASMASMTKDKDGKSISKAQMVANVCNDFFNEIVNVCQKSDGIRNYFDIMLIGYGENVAVAFEGKLAGKDWVSISDLKENLTLKKITENKTLPTGKVVQQEKTIHHWVSPKSNGGTPMIKAFDKVKEALETWIANHPHNYPPIVINITDGEQTDGSEQDMLLRAKAIRDLKTSNGNVILMNCHISVSAGKAVIFPSAESDLPNETYAKRLYRMSSLMPSNCKKDISIEILKNHDVLEEQEFVAMTYQAGVAELTKAINIGTKQSQQVK